VWPRGWVFHDRGTRSGWVVSSTPRPHFTPGKDPVPILQEAGWAPGPVWKGGKSRPHRDAIPDRPARSQSLYRLSYPAHWDPRYTFFKMYIRVSFPFDWQLISFIYSWVWSFRKMVCREQHRSVAPCRMYVNISQRCLKTFRNTNIHHQWDAVLNLTSEVSIPIRHTENTQQRIEFEAEFTVWLLRCQNIPVSWVFASPLLRTPTNFFLF